MRYLFLALLFSTSCKSTQKNYPMVSSASMNAEGHQIWTRPVEVGFTMGDYVQTTSSTTMLLDVFRISGDPVSSVPTIPTFGTAGILSPNAKFAVSKGVDSKKAEGMYILSTEDQRQKGLLAVTHTSIVKGYVLHFKHYGPIDDETMKMIRTGVPVVGSSISSDSEKLVEQEQKIQETNTQESSTPENNKQEKSKQEKAKPETNTSWE